MLPNRPKRSVKPPNLLKEYFLSPDHEDNEDNEQLSKMQKGQKLLQSEKHKLENDFYCSKCMKKFDSKENLNYHLRTHKERKSFLCEDCGKCLSSINSLFEHLNIHKNIKPYKCNICGHESRQISVHSKHLETHEESFSKVFSCSICAKTFSQKSYLKNHLRKHFGEKPYKCKECTKSFTSKSELNRHIVCHSKNRPYQCPNCHKRFKLKHNLVMHLKLHTGKRKWRCHFCSKEIKNKAALEEHEKLHKNMIQYLELVKMNSQTLTVMSVSTDRRKVPHHHQITLPEMLNLDDSEIIKSCQLSLAINDIYIPLHVIVSSFGTGNFVKIKIIGRQDLSNTESEAGLNVTLVGQDMKPIGDNLTIDNLIQEESNVCDREILLTKPVAEQCSSPSNQFISHCISFEEHLKDDRFPQSSFLWLKTLTDLTRKLNLPLDVEVCDTLHRIISELQRILIEKSTYTNKKDSNFMYKNAETSGSTNSMQLQSKSIIDEQYGTHIEILSEPLKNSGDVSCPKFEADSTVKCLNINSVLSIESGGCMEDENLNINNFVDTSRSTKELSVQSSSIQHESIESYNKNNCAIDLSKNSGIYIHDCYLSLLQVLHKHFRKEFIP